MHSSTKEKGAGEYPSFSVILVNSELMICWVLLVPCDKNVPSFKERGISDSFVFLRITSDCSLFERTRLWASEMRMSSSSMCPDEENGISLKRKHDETNKRDVSSQMQQWLLEAEFMESLMREDEVLRSERIGRLSDEENKREGGMMSKRSSGKQKITSIISH